MADALYIGKKRTGSASARVQRERRKGNWSTRWLCVLEHDGRDGRWIHSEWPDFQELS